jgi:hypothetical protein
MNVKTFISRLNNFNNDTLKLKLLNGWLNEFSLTKNISESKINFAPGYEPKDDCFKIEISILESPFENFTIKEILFLLKDFKEESRVELITDYESEYNFYGDWYEEDGFLILPIDYN